MTKSTRLLLLGVSLAANAVLAWRWLASSATDVGDASRAAAKSPATHPDATQASTSDPSRPAVATAPANHAELRDRLRALGFSEDEVRAAVRARLEAPRLARQREWLAVAARQPWWRGAATLDFTPTQDRELRALRQAEGEELLALFGPTALATSADLERYAYLPADKAARLAVLERDYAEFRRVASETGAGTGGGPERLRQLAEAHDRDLAALLTPAEQAQRSQLESQTALNLADYFNYFSPSEAEAQAIYGLRRAFDDQFGGGNAMSADAMRGRSAANQKLQQDLEAALGPNRYAEWQRAQKPEYWSLVEMQRRFAVPQAAIDTLAPLPAQTQQAAERIDADGTLTAVQKQIARAALVEQVKTQVGTTLGPELGGTYLSEVGRWWMVQFTSVANAARPDTMRFEAVPSAVPKQ